MIAGDTHNAWANELKDAAGDSVGVEFATSSVSSPGLEYYLGIDVKDMPATEEAILGLVDNLKYANLMNRGMLTLTFSHEQVRSDWRYVDTILTREFAEDIERGHALVTKVGVPSLEASA